MTLCRGVRRRARHPALAGSYEALVKERDVDAVYVPLPNALHVPWSIRALEAGRHVLCEKPLARRPADVEAALDAAEPAGRVPEGMMRRLHPRVAAAIASARCGCCAASRSASAPMCGWHRAARPVGRPSSSDPPPDPFVVELHEFCQAVRECRAPRLGRDDAVAKARVLDALTRLAQIVVLTGR